MQDTALYQYLLGLQSPWTVSRVNLDVNGQRVDVWAEHPENAAWVCPHCTKTLPLYDHVEERTWRHLDSCQFQTYLHASNSPRGLRRTWRGPGWCRGRSRGRGSRCCSSGSPSTCCVEADVTGATRMLRISWDEAWHIMERAVKRGPGPRRAGHRPSAWTRRRSPSGTATSRWCATWTGARWSTSPTTASRRAWTPTISAHAGATGGHRGGGHGHVGAVHHLDGGARPGRAVQDRLRPLPYHEAHERGGRCGAEGRASPAARRGATRPSRGRSTCGCTPRRTCPSRQRERFAALRALHLKTGRAWAIKESLRELWGYRRKGWALRHWKRWYFWATHSRLAPMVKVARMIREHLDNVLTYFEHRITNATSEGLNSKIQTIKKTLMGSGIGGT